MFVASDFASLSFRVKIEVLYIVALCCVVFLFCVVLCIVVCCIVRCCVCVVLHYL